MKQLIAYCCHKFSRMWEIKYTTLFLKIITADTRATTLSGLACACEICQISQYTFESLSNAVLYDSLWRNLYYNTDVVCGRCTFISYKICVWSTDLWSVISAFHYHVKLPNNIKLKFHIIDSFSCSLHILHVVAADLSGSKVSKSQIADFLRSMLDSLRWRHHCVVVWFFLAILVHSQHPTLIHDFIRLGIVVEWLVLSFEAVKLIL